jgi:hypothetical protein
MDTPTRTCTKCGVTKPATVEYFNRERGYSFGLNSRCWDCIREYRRNWQRRLRATDEGKKAHREATRKWESSEQGRAKHLAAKKAWRAANREKLNSLVRERRAAETSEERRARIGADIERRRRRLADDPELRIRYTVSSRIATALRNRGTSKRSRNWERLVGYTLTELKAHIERQFSRGMSWANYGKWHVDHIVPIAAFDWKSADDDAFKACWALTNLRPLWAEENRRKKDQRLYLI